jgi:UDP-N-acetylmuramate dehydrogenase
MLAGLARSAIREGWSGLEWAVSVPGTVGGAVIGNAGAHGGCIADRLAWAEVCYPGYGRRVLTAAELGYSYRSSVLKEQLAHRAAEAGSQPFDSVQGRSIVLRAAFNLTHGDVAEMMARADGFLARRRATQPVEPSAGSVFRNPPGDYAGRLIEAVGLKGQRLGGAQISPRHANFIVNTGNARAADVLGLICLARQRVYDQTGIELVLELLLLGEW